MRIGIDIDETLTDTEKSFNNVIKKYNVKFSKKYSEKWNEDEKVYLLSNFIEEILSNAVLKEGSKKAIDLLNNMGHELIVITARNNEYSNNIEAITRNLIRENKLKFSAIYFNQKIKSDIAKKLNIDLMIDDSVEVYKNMKKENIDCILFGDKIQNWSEVLEYIKGKEKSDG